MRYMLIDHLAVVIDYKPGNQFLRDKITFFAMEVYKSYSIFQLSETGLLIPSQFVEIL